MLELISNCCPHDLLISFDPIPSYFHSIYSKYSVTFFFFSFSLIQSINKFRSHGHLNQLCEENQNEMEKTMTAAKLGTKKKTKIEMTIAQSPGQNAHTHRERRMHACAMESIFVIRWNVRQIAHFIHCGTVVSIESLCVPHMSLHFTHSPSSHTSPPSLSLSPSLSFSLFLALCARIFIEYIWKWIERTFYRAIAM